MHEAIEITPEASPTEKDILNRLSAEDLTFVFERLLHKGEIDESDIPGLDIEFKKFMFLVWATEKPIAMIGGKPDEVWHQFILFTEAYEAFCNRTVGFFVDHTPDTDSLRVPDDSGEEFVKAYTKYFGDLPSLWTKGLSVDTAKAYAEWPSRGRPPVRWASVGSCARARR